MLESDRAFGHAKLGLVSDWLKREALVEEQRRNTCPCPSAEKLSIAKLHF
jgi:hypothetical protein